jgi:hypothetical protein
MAATKKSPAGKAKKRAKPAARKMTQTTASTAELKELDVQWRRFVKKSVPDVPLTEVWPDPKGGPSIKTTIRKAAKKKAVKKTATKKPAKKSAKKK